MMSFIALPMPTVLASFPNMALSFIRVAIFFLQANVTMSQDEAEDSSVGAQLGEAAVYNAWDKSNTLLNSTHFIAVNAPIKGEIEFAGREPEHRVENAKSTARTRER